MNLFIVVVFLFGICRIQSEISVIEGCTQYTLTLGCAKEKLNDDKCYSGYKTFNAEKTKITETVYVRNCDTSERCKIVIDGDFTQPDIESTEDTFNYGVCVKRRIFKFAGEKCATTTECFSGKCSGNKCEAIANGAKCSIDYSCASGSACVENTNGKKVCTPIVKAGEDCRFNDHLCPFDYVCGATTRGGYSNCEKMFSLETGAYSTHPLLCKTGYLYTEGSNSYYPEEDGLSDSTLQTFCAEAKLDSGVICKERSDCKYTITTSKATPNILGGCYCSVDGLTGYCEIGSTSDIVKNWIETYKKETTDMNTNDFLHLSYARNNNWENIKIQEARKRQWYYTALTQSDECAIRHYLNGNMNCIKILSLFLFALFLI